MIRVLRVFLASCIVLFLLLGIVSTAFAAPANPGSITIETCKVFQNIFETGDVLFVASHNVSYISEPSESASETFELAVYDTDGTTFLFDRPLNYYQYSIHSIYLDADAAASVTWGSEYRVRVMGNPIYFPLIEDTTMDTMILSASSSWIEGDMAASRVLLHGYCLSLATTLESALNKTLTIDTTEGTKLNSVGRTYFLAAIPYLDYAIPELFQVAISNVYGEDVPYGGAYEDATKIEIMLGAKIASAFTGIGEIFHLSGETAAFLWMAFIAVTIASIVFLSTGNTTVALVLSVPVLILGSYIGAIPLALIFVLATIIVIYLGYHIWLRGQ